MDNGKNKKRNHLNGSMNGSILNLNNGNDNHNNNKNNNNDNQNSKFSGYPGRFNNFTSSSSFKSPSVWNCDWNLNNIPEMHIK